MPDIDNLTPFAATALATMTIEGRDALLVCASARFDVVGLGPELVPSEVQPMPPVADEHYGDAGRTSLRAAGQCDADRPGTDVYVTGHARAPGGRPVLALELGVRVGALDHQGVAIGRRVWEKRMLGDATPSRAEPFDAIPLRWEHAFGGVAPGEGKPLWEPRNPVGCGLYRTPQDADGRPLPHFESRARPIASVLDRPAPIGFGPIPRHWEPRARFAGTYDERWAAERAPFWPDDLDRRFFFAAPPELQITPHVRGGEPVALSGMHPQGTLQFNLPRLALMARCEVRGAEVRQPLAIDAVHLDADAPAVTLIAKARFDARGDVLAIRNVALRQLAAWEEA